MFSLAARVFVDEDGVTMVEYGLMLAFIALVCLIAVALLGTNLSTFFSTTASSI
jgi:pilus assembly protein Flp/PilA